MPDKSIAGNDGASNTIDANSSASASLSFANEASDSSNYQQTFDTFEDLF